MDPNRYRLYVDLSASQVRKRLKGYGLGVRRIESVDRGRAVVIHTATGEHLRRLESLLADVISAPSQPRPDHPTTKGDQTSI
jgi:DNA transformation protein and related proteins